MKKFGFTMPELIITLAIVGVAAAVAAPVIGNLMPDKNKLKAIECYNLVNAATEEFLSDEGIYYAPDWWTYHNFNNDGSINYENPLANPVNLSDGYPDCEALMCWNEPPKRVPYVKPDLKEEKKYPGLLFTKYGLENLTSDSYTQGRSSDGTIWEISAVDILNSAGTVVQDYNGAGEKVDLKGYKIEFDVNPSNNNSDTSCFYSENCKSPDKFRIYVNHEGNIFAGDPMMEAYLLNPLNMHTKKEDKRDAEEYATSSEKNYENPRFLYTSGGI